MAISGLGGGSVFSKLAQSAPGLKGSALLSNITSVTIGAQAAGQNELIVAGIEKQIQRLQGFNPNISEPQSRRLAEARAEIQQIERNQSPAGLSDRLEKRRIQLFEESYKILGKRYVDIDSNPKLKEIQDKIDALLEPPLRGEKQARLERLRKLEQNYQRQFFRNPGNESNIRQLTNTTRQIASLVPPRLFNELSPAERREYDALAKQGNDIAGTEVFLSSQTQIKIESLQRTIGRFTG
ncbi:tetrapyrrole methylase [Tepidicaulis marinus]|jgi:hypothetical protein|uniref:Tetrapyrrole methylase n=1 Tax=Tepidicaulis marinus TaxID=1333998 RepID=A0A081B6T0_9HYPH|nr:hypothetical protein [Tepidicaulis marinus]GAK43748.1 tetrapyrrole methylase [Tepidicaulis marinus]